MKKILHNASEPEASGHQITLNYCIYFLAHVLQQGVLFNVGKEFKLILSLKCKGAKINQKSEAGFPTKLGLCFNLGDSLS